MAISEKDQGSGAFANVRQGRLRLTGQRFLPHEHGDVGRRVLDSIDRTGDWMVEYHWASCV